MKKNLKWIAGLAILVLLGGYYYNTFVGLNEGVGEAWGAVETAYQARADKVKGLEAIVKGAADFEQETLIGVTEARAKASRMTLQVDELTEDNIAKYQELQNNMTGALSRLLATFERYPDLKAVAAFRDFQTQYEGMENRIQTERNRFNSKAKEYNVVVKKFPAMMFAKIFGFDEKGYFSANEGAENAPDISFE
jgi:LemA protein